jgi:hypothetical protein
VSVSVLEWPERDVVFEKAEEFAARQSAAFQDPAVSRGEEEMHRKA